jgi:glucose/arabinose dehydrogenase
MARLVCFGTVLALAALTSVSPLWAQPQDSNFTQTTYASGVGQITDLAWATDGTNNYLFFTQQGGAVRVVRNGSLQSAAVVNVTPVVNSGEMGLLGICVDPSFAANRRIYVFVTETGSIQRIYRYTTTDSGGTVGTTGGRDPIGPDLPCMNANHDGGAVAFGPDGYLYFGVGNLGNGNNVGGDGTSNEYGTLGSKIGRMTASGRPVPTNPWYTDDGSDTARDYIFSRGWRNPFGICFQPGTADPWVLEVGDSWEHIFIAPAKSNRGWPTENNTSTTNGKLIPRLAYQRNSGPNWTSGGGCITRGCFYTGSSFPSAYQGNLFFCEYNGGKLVRVVPNGTGTIPSSNVSLFVDNVPGIVDVEVGPDGALYYASRGNSAIYRLQYSPATPQNIILSTNTLTIDEGSSGTFTVRLATAPSSNVTVNVARSSGDSDVTASPATLTFTPSNWNMPQTVTVSAAQDADSTNDGATITCSSTGLTPQNVAVTVRDDDPVNGAPSVTIVQPVNGAEVSGSQAEWYGNVSDPQGVNTIVRGEFYVDGVLVYTDPNPGTESGWHPHYGGDHNRWDTTTLADGVHVLRLTVYDSGGLSGSHEITVTVRNGSSTLVYQPDPSGLVSIEAEDFDERIARGDAWTPVTAPAGYSGSGALQALPNDGTIFADGTSDYVNGSPELRYRVNFKQAGTYVVWVRGHGPSGSDDSVHVGLDGASVASAERIDVVEGTTGYVWSNQTMAPGTATLTVSQPGVHVVHVWMREDGFVLDKIVLTPDTAFTPSGFGPAPSPRVSDSDFDGIPDSEEGAGGGGGGGSGGSCGALGLEALLAALLARAATRKARRA